MKEEKKANRTNKMRNKQCGKMTEKDERIEEEWKFKQEIWHEGGKQDLKDG